MEIRHVLSRSGPCFVIIIHQDFHQKGTFHEPFLLTNRGLFHPSSHTHTHTHICTAQLEIGTNQLTGTMPTELGKLTLMKDLEVQNNTLTGPIPSEIGLMTSLGKFVLNRNGKDVLPCGVLSQTIGRIHKY